MRHAAVAILSVLGIVGTQQAIAADLPMKAPAPALTPAAVVHNWTGFYVGINGGYGWADHNWTYVAGGVTVNHTASGGLIGGTIGGNYQIGNWVLGAEADWDWAQINGSAACPNPLYSCKTEMRSIGTVRARAGYAWNNVLLYGTGGFAWGDMRVETTFLPGGAIPPSGTSTNGSNRTLTGWTAGAGIEFAFLSNWSAKFEYLYYDLGADRFPVDFGLRVSASPKGNIIRVGVNYHFH